MNLRDAINSSPLDAAVPKKIGSHIITVWQKEQDKGYQLKISLQYAMLEEVEDVLNKGFPGLTWVNWVPNGYRGQPILDGIQRTLKEAIERSPDGTATPIVPHSNGCVLVHRNFTLYGEMAEGYTIRSTADYSSLEEVESFLKKIVEIAEDQWYPFGS